jgi:CRISPR/Cas system CMR-associated protein Cmr5 small subunit
MKNLEQIRAANALAYAKAGVNTRASQGGDVVRGLPAMIMSNGLLAAGAFAYAKGENDGWYLCFDHLTLHLQHELVAIVPSQSNGLEGLLNFLTSKDATSETLKLATDEALAWLIYARRFVRKGGSNGGPDDSNS